MWHHVNIIPYHSKHLWVGSDTCWICTFESITIIWFFHRIFLEEIREISVVTGLHEQPTVVTTTSIVGRMNWSVPPLPTGIVHCLSPFILGLEAFLSARFEVPISNFGGHKFFLWDTGTLDLDFWWCLPWVQSQVDPLDCKLWHGGGEVQKGWRAYLLLIHTIWPIKLFVNRG